jgi:hypothetical protein
MEKNICIKCGIEKPISEYSKSIHMKSGFRNTCKSCSSIIKKIWKQNNPEKVKEARKRWRQNKPKKIRECKKNNPEKVKEARKRWRENNPDKVRESRKRWKENNLDKVREGRKRWKKNNLDKVTESKKVWKENSINPVNKFCRNCNIELCSDNSYPSAGNACKECEKQRMKDYRKNYPQKRKETKVKWQKNNQDKVKISKKRYTKKRLANDPVYRAMRSMRSRTFTYAKKKFSTKRNTFSKIIGNEGLREYIKSKFQEGMSWDNYSWSTWHLDHIVPLSSATTIKELEELSHYTNLQPLWAEDNFKKSDNIL